MSNNGVETKPSETAFFAALRRTIAHKEYGNEKWGPDYLAASFLPAHYRFLLRFKRIRENTKSRLSTFMPGLNEYMIARTIHFDRLFAQALENGVPQIVLLGAGYDSRAYRFAPLNSGTQIFELDIAPTQNEKRKCLQQARIDIPPQVTFVPIDFNKEALGDVLGRAGYVAQNKTLFIWEGVSYYLDVASVDNTLAFVNQDTHENNVIAFDYTVTLTPENMANYYGAQEFAQTMKEQHAGEELLFSIPEGGIESFLAQRKLAVVNHLDNNEMENAYLLRDDGSLIGHVTGHFRFVSAAPQI